jgi:hypothetical protein
MTQQNIKQIKDAILARIKNGQVSMRPKWHFVLKTLLIAVGGVLVLLAALYLVSFMVFVTRQSGAWFGTGFGGPGFGALLRSLPWTLIVLSLIFIALVEVVARRYAFAYRQPLLYSAVIVILLVLVGGALMAPLHQVPFQDMRMHRLPMFAERFYRDFGPPPLPSRELYRGVAVELLPGGFVMEDFQGSTTTVRFGPSGRMTQQDALSVGDEVVVFGMSTGTEVLARGVRILVPASE